MEQTANTMPAAALGQYKGLAFTRRVRPVSDLSLIHISEPTRH